jgi:RNA polymerase sigma factor (sigma-70 family)
MDARSVAEPSDIQLLGRWRDGDSSAGERLFERHASSIAFFFRNKVPGGSEDFVQQTFLGLVEGRARLGPETNVRAYLFGIAHNILRKHLRKLSRSPGFDPGVTSAADIDPGPSTIMAKKREHRLLLEGLRHIPMDHQIALELYYWEELNAAEIAEIVGVSHSAMRSRLSKARKLLERAIAELATSAELERSTLGGLEQWAADIRARRG